MYLIYMVYKRIWNICEMMNKIDVSLKIFIIEPIFRPKNVIFLGSLFWTILCGGNVVALSLVAFQWLFFASSMCYKFYVI